MPSTARLLLYSYVQRDVMYVNIIETFWNSCCSCQHGMDDIINIEQIYVHTPALV
ncbi:hypothetical protein T05_15597 [Trichinella murrelli]|uniref:Uncharacterized protein n=1 Tax=Trichinella murrelli TaxID=144512 RepID=A0A0V0T7F7_9BILA|nr:hypothetical protein T05_15597 [Trichinella murrelli]